MKFRVSVKHFLETGVDSSGQTNLTIDKFAEYTRELNAPRVSTHGSLALRTMEPLIARLPVARRGCNP